MKYYIVGGDWGEQPRSSNLVTQLFAYFSRMEDANAQCDNGGYFAAIADEFPKLVDADVILWMPNIDNEYEKIRNIKELYPTKILITSKRNIDGKYSFAQLVDHALHLKSHLVIEFTGVREDAGHKIYSMRVFDPLGNVYAETEDLFTVVNAIHTRVRLLLSLSRQHTTSIGDSISAPDVPEFYGLVKDYAEIFHSLIHPPEEVHRFLGNTAFRAEYEFRCERGFPSVRDQHLIFVSQRDVDKRYIDQTSFVAVDLNYFAETGNIGYYGNVKPSVDTPIQLRLFSALPNINYMLHSHVYVEGAPFTDHNYPCGSLEEVDEILNTINSDLTKTDFAVNLLGHGSIIFASTITYLQNLPYYARPTPERVEQE